MVDTAAPLAVFVAIVLSLIPHDMQYGPQAALIAEAFTPRLRYSGASLGYQLASVIAGGPAPLIATALFASYHSGRIAPLCSPASQVLSMSLTSSPRSSSAMASGLPDAFPNDRVVGVENRRPRYAACPTGLRSFHKRTECDGLQFLGLRLAPAVRQCSFAPDSSLKAAGPRQSSSRIG
jgi:hypothetical protein